jgi:hypothetical protein
MMRGYRIPMSKWAGERQEKDKNRQFLVADAKAKDGYEGIQNPHVKWAGERQEKDWNR